jgi:hypothetical protein
MRTSQKRAATELKPAQAKTYATMAVPFSRVASDAYCKHLTGTDSAKARREECNNVPPLLSASGWIQLYHSEEILSEEEKATGLEFVAFGRDGPKSVGEIIIGFRGTDFTSLSDWRSNLRWFTRVLPLSGPDQYQVVHSHTKELVDLALKEANNKIPSAVRFDVYSTGHSLGGGLAQLLAYSDSRVKGAVVFDPSPVTGYNQLVTDEQVNCSARIVRIYERGEALQYVRSVLRRFYNLSSNITEISFDLLHSGGNPFANHSMSKFRLGLDERVSTKKCSSQSISELPGDPDCEASPPVAPPNPALSISELPGDPDCECYRDRRPNDQSKDAKNCPESFAAATQ